MWPWPSKSHLFIVHAVDGGHHTEVLELTHGIKSFAEHIAYDQGMAYGANGKVFFAFIQTSPKKRNADNGAFDNYAGRQMVAALDDTTGQLAFLKEQA